MEKVGVRRFSGPEQWSGIRSFPPLKDTPDWYMSLLVVRLPSFFLFHAMLMFMESYLHVCISRGWGIHASFSREAKRS